jgi:hypothetical protein
MKQKQNSNTSSWSVTCLVSVTLLFVHKANGAVGAAEWVLRCLLPLRVKFFLVTRKVARKRKREVALFTS